MCNVCRIVVAATTLAAATKTLAAAATTLAVAKKTRGVRRDVESIVAGRAKAAPILEFTAAVLVGVPTAFLSIRARTKIKNAIRSWKRDREVVVELPSRSNNRGPGEAKTIIPHSPPTPFSSFLRIFGLNYSLFRRNCFK